jgi:hypothetical protein
MVLQNVPFDVIDWDEVAEKFDVGVNVNNNDAVVGVDGSNLRACLDSLLPSPLNDSSDFFYDLKLTEWAGILVLTDILTSNIGAVERLSN